MREPLSTKITTTAMYERGVQCCFFYYIIGKALTNTLPKDIVRVFFGLLNANSLLVMRLCAYYGGFANWWRETHPEAHKRVLHFFANRPPGSDDFFSNLIKMLVTGITTIVSL